MRRDGEFSEKRKWIAEGGAEHLENLEGVL